MHRHITLILLLIVLLLGASNVTIGALGGPPPGGDNTVYLPVIQSVSPSSGSPMDTILIKGVYIPADKSNAEVWFTLAPSTITKGTILNASESHGLITYWVQVPGDGSITAPYQGTVYVMIKDSGKVTGSRPFRIIPILPKITGHSPQYGAPGKTTTFRGSNFKSTDEVSLSSVGVVPFVFRSATEIAVTLPSNYPTTDRLISVNIRRKGASSTYAPSQYKYALDPKLLPENKDNQTGRKVESKDEGQK